MSQPSGLFRGKFLVLDLICVRDYPLFVMGSGDSTLNGSVSRAERKSKSPQATFGIIEGKTMRTEGLSALMMIWKEEKIGRRTFRNIRRSLRLRPRLERVDIGPGRAKWIRTRLAQIARRLERLEDRRQDVLWYFKNKWLEERGHLFE
jgi:hypothetical protein